jgi:hypothetical protein
METQAKHNARSNFYIGRPQEQHIAGLLRQLTPIPKAVEWMAPAALYPQRSGSRSPGVLACHNAQAQAGRWPSLEYLAGQSGHVLVRLPDAAGPGADARMAMLEAAKEFGDVADKVRAAFEHDGAGGTRCTAEELAAVKREALEAIGKLHQVVETMARA